MTKINNILLVDKDDLEMGVAEKMLVHKKGLLHRAFSILIFNKSGELLIQKRSREKYHSGGLWANTCCSHQREGELLEKSIHNRLKEEFGFDVDLKEIYKFHYRISLDKGLIENEIDHVFLGKYDGVVIPNPDEIEDFKWISLERLSKEIKSNKENYAYWFRLILKEISDKKYFF